MLDYHLHFAQLVAEDHLKAADERRRTKGVRHGSQRVFQLGKRHDDGRQRSRR